MIGPRSGPYGRPAFAVMSGSPPPRPHASSSDARAGSSESAPDQLFGAALKPTLEAACDNRLTDLQWFRTDWQRGGALTGYALFTTDDGPVSVVIKVPVPPQELTWLERLQPRDDDDAPVVPRLFAADRHLDGYDLAWVVMERLTHGPLDQQWHGSEIELLAEAAGRFYAAAARFPLDQERRDESWVDVLKRCRQSLKDFALPESQRWNAAIKALQKKFDKTMRHWLDHEPGWCHGDLHLGNAMTQTPPPGGPAFLFDLAKVHCGHWIEDAVYFEHLFWSKPSRLHGHDVPKLIAQERRKRGLSVVADWPRLACFRRALVAASAPAEQGFNPNLHHLAAALQQLERTTPTL